MYVDNPQGNGGGEIQLNMMVKNLALSTEGGASSGRHTLSVTTTAQSKVMHPNAKSVEFIPSVIPTAAIFIRWHTNTDTTAVTSGTFDDVWTEVKFGSQLGRPDGVTGYSILGASGTQTVYTVER